MNGAIQTSAAVRGVSADAGHGRNPSAQLPTPRSDEEADPKGSASQPDLTPEDYRLVIEEDAELGSILYKTVDHRTGEVIAQRAREQVMKLADTPDYVAGSLIKAKA